MTVRRALDAVILLATLTFAGCESVTGADQRIRVEPSSAAVIIGNDGEDAIFVTAYSEDILPLVTFGSCVRDECGRIEPGESRQLAVNQIMGASTGEWVRVFYWSAIPSPDGTSRPGPVSNIRVQLVDS